MANGNKGGTAALKVLNAAVWIIYAILTFASIVLAFGFALLLFGADPNAGFADFIYTSAGRFMDPFRGLVEPTSVGESGLVAWSALFAIAAYLVLMWVVSLVAGSIRKSVYQRERTSPPAKAYPAAPSGTTATSPESPVASTEDPFAQT